MTRQAILVVDDEPDIRNLVKDILEDEGFLVQVAESGEQARELFAQEQPQLVLLDIWMPDLDGISLLKEWKEQRHGTVPVVMMSGHGTVETAVEATRLGAYDFVEKPLSHAKLLLVVRHALLESGLRLENLNLRKARTNRHEDIVGKSRAMQGLRDKLGRIAQHDQPVLISGPPGTDKESCARHMHELGGRGNAPFVAANVTGIDRAASELLLFGDADTLPCLEHARGGTLFVKDIAELDMVTQSRLCHTIEERTFRAGNKGPVVKLDARIVAATRGNLQRLVQEGKFNEDLFYQFNILTISVPALSEHVDDIPELLDYYVDYLVDTESLPFRKFTVAAKNRLRAHRWPGNLRELKNLVQRLLILGDGETISVEELESVWHDRVMPGTGEAGQKTDSIEFNLPMRDAREKFERAYLTFQLDKNAGNVNRTANAIGMQRAHLYRKLKALGINLK